MNIQLIRNACIIIEYQSHRVLVDPCLNPKGTLPPYTLFRKKPRFNPLIDLPENADESLKSITAGLITHCRNGHFDHLDRAGCRFLRQTQVPVYCTTRDESFLMHRHLVTRALVMNQKNEFPGGSILPVPTVHGHGLTGKLMGSGAGYFIELEDEHSIYISGDTVMNQTVRSVLTEMKPDISIVNAGTAVLDVGRPILMTIEEILEFIHLTPGKVMAVHMDAFNHCLTSRDTLRKAIQEHGLSDKVFIPEDGESVAF